MRMSTRLHMLQSLIKSDSQLPPSCSQIAQLLLQTQSKLLYLLLHQTAENEPSANRQDL